jgi:hypothetical protein
LPGSFSVFRLLDAPSFSNPALTRQLINSIRASSFPASTAVSSTSSVVIAGKRVEWRAHNEPKEGSYFCAPGEKISPTDRLIKRIEMTKDLCDLIVFMVNSYIRPTDIRNMQHKHVEVIKLEIVLEVTGLKLSTAEETLTLYSL